MNLQKIIDKKYSELFRKRTFNDDVTNNKWNNFLCSLGWKRTIEVECITDSLFAIDELCDIINSGEKVFVAECPMYTDDVLVFNAATVCNVLMHRNLKCEKHPKYQAKRKPRSTCKTCWEIWNNANK